MQKHVLHSSTRKQGTQKNFKMFNKQSSPARDNFFGEMKQSYPNQQDSKNFASGKSVSAFGSDDKAKTIDDLISTSPNPPTYDELCVTFNMTPNELDKLTRSGQDKYVTYFK